MMLGGNAFSQKAKSTLLIDRSVFLQWLYFLQQISRNSEPKAVAS